VEYRFFILLAQGANCVTVEIVARNHNGSRCDQAP